MKVMKYTAVLALAFFACVSLANAQSIVFLGGGSSGLNLELGQAAWTYEHGLSSNTGSPNACIWTAKKDPNIVARDTRTGSNVDTQGTIWIVWGSGSGTCDSPSSGASVYVYMSIDSGIGNRCFFEVDPIGNVPGCVQIFTPASIGSGSGKNLLGEPTPTSCTSFCDNANGLPTSINSLLNGQNLHWNVAGSDLRPEDMKYATYRALAACGSPLFRQAFDQQLRQTYGLGYGVSQGVGININSVGAGGSSAASIPLLDFNFTGADPINTTHNTYASGAWNVSVVGAQPIVVVVGAAPGSFGNGLFNATDIPAFVLMNFFDGTLGRANDLIPPAGKSIANWPVTTYVREPISGTYNTFEYSIPNNSQFHDSQDAFNCNQSTGALVSNPLNLKSMNGKPASPGGSTYGSRQRVGGTGEMIAGLQAGTEASPALGYFFWSAANASTFTTATGKYLTVNGVDPLQNAYTNGQLPGSIGGPALSNVTFQNVANGDYPIWSPLRLIYNSSSATAVANLINAAQTLNSTQNDFIPLTKLLVWHSHYYMPSINVNASANGNTLTVSGDLCSTGGTAGNVSQGASSTWTITGTPGLAEAGGDAGGANITKQANYDFCQDFPSAGGTGLINKTN